ncbi:MAG: hypothetical protein H8E45_05995 [Proteobacteria bacterium]|nr:hypothetical protein [Pseudomonadota bacterium]
MSSESDGGQSVSKKKRGVEAEAVVALFALAGLVTAAYGSQDFFPELASRHGEGIDAMLNFVLACAGGMFLVGHLVLAWFIWKGAGRSRIEHRMATHTTERRISLALAVMMTLIAEGGVLMIGMPVWAEYYGSDGNAQAVAVRVTAQQFAWNIHYPGADGKWGRVDLQFLDDAENPLGLDPDDPASADDLVLVNNIYLPVERMARVKLFSRDVIHSFFLPNMRVKQDAVPGMSPEVRFFPTRTGDFELACTELCGMGHYRMQGMVHVLGAEEFEKWLADEEPFFGAAAVIGKADVQKKGNA